MSTSWTCSVLPQTLAALRRSASASNTSPATNLLSSENSSVIPMNSMLFKVTSAACPATANGSLTTRPAGTITLPVCGVLLPAPVVHVTRMGNGAPCARYTRTLVRRPSGPSPSPMRSTVEMNPKGAPGFLSNNSVCKRSKPTNVPAGSVLKSLPSTRRVRTWPKPANALSGRDPRRLLSNRRVSKRINPANTPGGSVVRRLLSSRKVSRWSSPAKSPAFNAERSRPDKSRLVTAAKCSAVTSAQSETSGTAFTIQYRMGSVRAQKSDAVVRTKGVMRSVSPASDWTGLISFRVSWAASPDAPTPQRMPRTIRRTAPGPDRRSPGHCPQPAGKSMGTARP